MITAGADKDNIVGGAGNDTINLENDSARDVVSCDSGDDTVNGVGPEDVISRDCEHVS